MKLSACLITRNEERMLARCLASLAGVDEIVVVDTGSTDRTIEIAENFGARVVRWAWRDDFAAARNVSIDHASGDWTIFVDADEALAPGDLARIRRAIEKPQTDAMGVDIFAIELHEAERVDSPVEAVLSGAERVGDPNHVVRVARRAPHVRFTGIVHETLETSVAAAGRRGGILRAKLVHYGAVPALRTERAKDARNETLLRRRLAADPGDVEAAGYLALALVMAERLADATEAAKAGWLALRAAADPPHVHGGKRLAVSRTILAALAGDWIRVVETADDAAALIGSHTDLDIMRADALWSLGCIEDALESYLAIAAAPTFAIAQTVVPMAREFRAPLGAARCLAALGRYDLAISYYDAAIAAAPRAPNLDDIRAARDACASARALAA